MRISPTRGRREPARNGEESNGDHPSVLEILVKNLTERVAHSATMRVKHGVQDVVRWTVLQLILGWIGAATLTGGVFLLFGAGVKGLEALHCPLWLAWLSTGVFAVLVALVAMKGILWPRKDREDD